MIDGKLKEKEIYKTVANLVAKKEYDEAIKLIEEVFPNDKARHKDVRGYIACAKNEYDDAIDNFKTAYHLMPDATRAFRIALSYDTKKNQWKNVKEWLDRALEMRSGYEDALHFLSTKYWKQFKFKDTIFELRKGAKSNPSSKLIKALITHTYVTKYGPLISSVVFPLLCFSLLIGYLFSMNLFFISAYYFLSILLIDLLVIFLSGIRTGLLSSKYTNPISISNDWMQ